MDSSEGDEVEDGKMVFFFLDDLRGDVRNEVNVSKGL